MPEPFEIQTRLTRIAMGVLPEGLIADMVLPRISVPASKFTYTKSIDAEQLSIPDTRIGRTSRANQVEFGAQDVTDSVKDYGLEDPVPIRDINVARDSMANWDPYAQATEGIASLLRLDREKRVATLYETDGNFTTVTTPSAKWDASSNPNSPVKDIFEALDKPLMRPNTAVMGQAMWTFLRQDSRIVEAVKGTGAGDGAVGAITREQFRELFELDAVYVGRAWNQTAKPGQNATYARLWGKSLALVKLSTMLTNPMLSAALTWGFTAEWMGMRAGTYLDPSRGTDGADVVKVVDSCVEEVSHTGMGVRFKAAIA